MDLSRQYVFHAPTRVIFGKDAVQATGPTLAGLGGRKTLVVTDAGVVKAGLLDPVQASLASAGIAAVVFDDVEPNPSVRTVEKAEAAYRESGCNALLAVGGGSPMD